MRKMVQIMFLFGLLFTLSIPHVFAETTVNEREIIEAEENYSNYDTTTPPQDYDSDEKSEVNAAEDQEVRSFGMNAMAIEPAEKQILILQNANPWGTYTNQNILNNLGLSYDIKRMDQVSTINLSQYRMIFIANDQHQSFYDAYSKNISLLEDYVRDGGRLLFGISDRGWNSGRLSSNLPGGVDSGSGAYEYRNVIAANSHPVVTGELSEGSALTNTDLYHNYTSHRYVIENSLPSGSKVILRGGNSNAPTLVEYPLGDGVVIASGLTWEHNFVYGSNFARKAYDDLLLYAYGAEEKETIVFIPGTAGSALYDGDNQVWLDELGAIFGDDLEKLNYESHPNLSINGEETVKYGDFKGDFEELGYNVEVFTYDWRADINENAERLHKFITDIGAAKVDIVAHSQGGLLATQFANSHPEKIDQIVNVGTPYFGSPKSLYMLMTGNLHLMLNADVLKSALQTMPAVYYMLPNKHYFEHDYYYEYLIRKDGKENLVTYDNFADTQRILGTFLNGSLLDDFEAYQNQFDPYHPANVEVWNIVGDGIGTIGRIGKEETIRNMGNNLVWEDIYEIDTITGDETVPLISANRGTKNNQARTFYYDGAAHSKQMLDENVLEKIDYILSDTPDKGSSELRTEYEIGDRLVLTINSPVDLHIYDSEQAHSGPTENNPDLIENTIEGASYWTIDHNKFASLQEGSYRVELHATDNGVFSFTLEDLVKDEIEVKVLFKDVKVIKGARVYADIDSSDVTTVELQIDKDRDGTIDQTVQPSFVGQGELADDSEAPELKVDVDGTKGNGDWYTSNVEVKMTAADNEAGAGINAILYQLNDGNVVAYENPLKFSAEGNESYTIKATAEDKMGNYSGFQHAEFKIDKTAPAIVSHLNKGYMIGDTLELDALVEVSDETSGVSSTSYQLDGKEVSGVIELNEAGRQVLKVTAEDHAGNISVYEEEISVSIPADIQVEPGTVKLKENKGKSPITVYIQLPEEYPLENIQLATISLNGEVGPIMDSKRGYVKNPIGDNNKDGKLEYMVKFDRNDVVEHLQNEQTNMITITGTWKDSTDFKGSASIVIK